MQIEYRCKSISLIEGDAETPLSLEYRYVPATVGAGGEILMEGQAVSGCVACAPETLDTPVPIAPVDGGGTAVTRTVAEMLSDAASLLSDAGLNAAMSAALDAAAPPP